MCAGMKNSNNNNRTCHIVNCAVPVDHRVTVKEREQKDKYLDLARKKKKNYEGESRTNCNLWPQNGAKVFGKESK